MRWIDFSSRTHVVLSSFLMRAFRSVFLFCTSVTLFVTTASFAFAADSAVRSALDQAAAGPRGSGFRNICMSTACVGTILGGLINIVLGLMGVALIGYILYAGFLWMTAGGEDKQVESARTMIRNAVIGVAILGASYTLTSVMVRLVGDTFTSTGPTTLAQPETPASTPTTTPTPSPAPRGLSDPYGLGCTRASCIPLCIEQECVGPLRAQARFTCEGTCTNNCNIRCAASGPPVPGATSGCDTNACESACISRCPAPVDVADGIDPFASRGTGARSSPETIACRAACHTDCAARLCTTDAATGIAESCRDSAGYRRCQDACGPAADARTASVTPPETRLARRTEEFDLCSQRCTRDNCAR